MGKTRERFYIDCEHCAVKEVSMFSVLCTHEQNELQLNKSCTSYNKGQLLFHEGTRPLGVFCINKGKVKIYKMGNEGKEQIVHVAKQGGLLGYRTMLSEETYSVSGEALEDTDVCFIPKAEFLSLIQGNSSLHSKILKAACKELGEMTDKVTEMAQKSVRERAATTLLMLKDTYGMNGHDDGPVEINLTREDLANTVGTATETMIRMLHDFKNEGLIEVNGRKIKVLDPKGLARVASIF